jgi:hypothetical protein
MNKPRNGKIARLPRDIRERLNSRLQNGEQGKALVAWLNALPAVRLIVAGEFGGKPVRAQNLSEWRKGGYREWLVQQDALEAVRRLNGDNLELLKGAGLEFTDNVALWLTSRYLVAGQRMEKEGGELDWQRMREFCSDLVALRRGDHSAARLLIESKRQIAQEGYARDRWRRQVIQGLESLKGYVDKHPKAKEAFNTLVDLIKTPMDEAMEGP